MSFFFMWELLLPGAFQAGKESLPGGPTTVSPELSREKCKAVCEPSTAQMCHTWMDPTRGEQLYPEPGNLGIMGSCAKAGREIPQAWLEELPRDGLGRATNVPWSGVAQMFPEGLKDPKPHIHAWERRW